MRDGEGGSIPTSPLQFCNLNVKKISFFMGKEFVKKYHYTGGIKGSITYGLFSDYKLIGVCAFATPSSENVCASVFGIEPKRSVTELHRLVLLDWAPKNSESWFISRALKLLKKDKPFYNAVLSFADINEGHSGIIYQATNAIYTGTSNKSKFYLDQNGRLRHPRHNGHNITKQEAELKGWKLVKREGKYRYLYLLPNDKRHKKELLKMLLLKSLPYPKEVNGVANA
jgi:hypothetical protein